MIDFYLFRNAKLVEISKVSFEFKTSPKVFLKNIEFSKGINLLKGN